MNNPKIRHGIGSIVPFDIRRRLSKANTNYTLRSDVVPAHEPFVP